MTKLHRLRPPRKSRHSRKRVGRGIGSGMGKNSGRGTNGQNSRSGGGVRPGFEGGQMPLYRRLPKVGFSNPFRSEYSIVNVGDLNRFAEGEEITVERLEDEGLVSSVRDGVKILGKGELEVSLTVRAHKFSESARRKIDAAGGRAEVI
ncbi:MAG: 50S ribosomal protein L15 [Bacillota bacterium]